MNWNDRVSVKLTHLGHNILRAHFKDLPVPYPPHSLNGDTFTEELWSIANIFAEYLYNGCTATVSEYGDRDARRSCRRSEPIR